MINILIGLVVALVSQAQQPNVSVPLKIDALQLASQILVEIKNEQIAAVATTTQPVFDGATSTTPNTATTTV
jgi:hypothetical protein